MQRDPDGGGHQPGSEHSANACPACGERRLALAPPPRIDVMGVQQHSDLFGFGDRQAPPAIECLACGTRWADAEALRDDRRDASGDVPLP